MRMMDDVQPVLQPVPLPDELRAVPRLILEEYVAARMRQFAVLFGGCLNPSAPASVFEAAYNEANQRLGSGSEGSNLDNLSIKFRHRCRFLGCANKDCVLCKNNPHKRCKEDDNFDECYADCQVLRSKCESDIHLHITNSLTGLHQNVPGLELQVCVIDGESWSEGATSSVSNLRRLLKSDEGDILLATNLPGNKADAEGYMYLKPQDGQVRLPDVSITDKNDTFHLNGESYSTFRLLAQAVKRDLFGKAVPLPVPPAISGKFVVKTQRALNDYRKCEYPHYKDELTKLKFIGSITAQRLREIQTHLGCDVPFTSIETVEQLKHLMLYADQNRQVESKLLELLNMKGKHKQKWEYLREVLNEKIVYDDMLQRAWYSDDTLSQGLLFSCKQGQVNLDKPVGVFRRVQQGTQGCLQVFAHMDPATMDIARVWRAAAEQSWTLPGHGRWAIAQERLEVMSTEPTGLATFTSGGGTTMHMQALSGTMSPALSSQDPLEDPQTMFVRQSIVSSPRSRSRSRSRPDTPSELRMAAAAAVAQQHSSGGGGVCGSGGGMNSSTGMMPIDMPAPRALQAGPVVGGHMPAHLSYAYHSVSPPAAGISQDNFRSGFIDPSARVFQFMSAPPTQACNVSPRSELNDTFHRMYSAQHTQSTGRATGGLQTRLSTGSQDTAAADRARRNRRLSADVMSESTGVQLASAPHTSARGCDGGGSSSEAWYHTHHHQPIHGETGVLKRPRSSAPSGLYGGEGFSVSHFDEDMPLSRGRVNIYHSESHGRHLPRVRKSHENLALSLEPPNLHNASVFYPHDVDIEHLLQNLDSAAYAPIKQEITSGSDAAMILDLQHKHMSSIAPLQPSSPQPLNILATRAHAPACSPSTLAPSPPVAASLTRGGWQSQELAAGLQQTLKLAEPLAAQHIAQMQHVHAAQQQGGVVGQKALHSGVINATGVERAPMLLGVDGDMESFRSLNRMLQGSDSDSFNRLNFSGGATSLLHSFPATLQNDASFDKALQDIIQGRPSLGNM